MIIWRKGFSKTIECPNPECSYLKKWGKKRTWALRKPLTNRILYCEFCHTRIEETRTKA